LYSYTFDEETGGILLNSSPTVFSKEPRPVYASELDMLGFDKYWKYKRQDDVPYMWAESVQYWYRGKLVAKLKGGNLYEAPEIIIPKDDNGNPVLPERDGVPLRPIDIKGMVRKNRAMMDIIENTTIKKIVAAYERNKNRLDIFHVAFSGGKASAVLLNLVKRALPKESFVVIFGDTGMEFPDTYANVEQVRSECEKEGIPFYIARSHMDPHESWKIFGPPARVLRWCCSVHKSAPQTILLRKITGKENYVGMDFVGVRKYESINRSGYIYENYGKKQRGQYSYNAILEWTSAEIWLYIYAKNIYINKAYKMGNSRVGCLFCPMSGNLSSYIRRRSYTKEVDSYVKLIRDSQVDQENQTVTSYIVNGGWNARKNGRSLRNNEFRCIESISAGELTIDIKNPTSSWREWMKTIGKVLKINNERYSVLYKDRHIEFLVKSTREGYVVKIPEKVLKEEPTFGKLFKQVFRKATYCIGCRVCEMNCPQGCISFLGGNLKIDGCIQCHQCHNIDSGCLLFHSTRYPQGGGKEKMSLNSFADHAPKTEWLQSFFTLKEEFFQHNTLGPMMYDMFRRFLRDSGLSYKNHFTEFAELISQIGWDTDTAMGLILTNLSMINPQIKWYIKNLQLNVYYARKDVEEMLMACDVKAKDAKSIVKSYKRIVETPIGTVLGFGYVTDDYELVRTRCNISDNKVILYALYKFAERCNNYKEFTLSWLMNGSIERDGISPSEFFGINYEDMKSILMGLTAKYPEFINATFTNDLEKITLTEKSSNDVLGLFRGE
jgi:phosphoadenosine phosphosulfate reductase